MIKNQRNILQKRKKKIQEKLNEKNIEPTGFPGHDESFLTINGCPPKIIFVVEPSKWPHLALIGM